MATGSAGNKEADSLACEPGMVPQWGDKVLVPLDGSGESAAVLPLARAVARLVEATVHIVHAGETLVPPAEMARYLGLRPADMDGAVIDRVAGSPAEVIVRLQQDNRLSPVVLSARGRGTPPEEAIGPVAANVVQNSRGPVVLVWPEHPERPASGDRPWRRILLPLDGTPSTSFAIAPAVDLAERSMAELILLYIAVTGRQRPPERGTLTPPKYIDQPQHEWPDWATELMERVWQVSGCQPTRIPVRISMASGEPMAEIAGFAAQQQVDLIAFAWHGRFIRGGPIYVASGLREAGCPVLFLHAPARVQAAERPSRPRRRERRQAA